MSDAIQEHLDPGLLSEILAKSATALSDEEIDVLIRTLRGERALMLAAEAANRTKPRSAVKVAVDKGAALNLKFEDLGI